MDELEKKIKELEIQEKKLKNRTIWITVWSPIVVVVISVLASYLTTRSTVRSGFQRDIQDYTQDRISELLDSKSTIEARQKIDFLLNSELIGTTDSRPIIRKALDEFLVNPIEAKKYYLKGLNHFNNYFEENDPAKSKKEIFAAIIEFNKAIANDPYSRLYKEKLGLSYYNYGTYDKNSDYSELAVAVFEEMISQDPSDVYAKLFLAKALINLNKSNNACLELSQIENETLPEWRIKEINELKEKHCK